MAKSKVDDFYPLVDGQSSEQASADMSSVQASFDRPETWAELPRDRRPERWWFWVLHRSLEVLWVHTSYQVAESLLALCSTAKMEQPGPFALSLGCNREVGTKEVTGRTRLHTIAYNIEACFPPVR